MKKESLWSVSVLTSPEAEDAVGELLGSVLESPPSGYHDFETRLVTVSAYVTGKVQREWWERARKAIKFGLAKVRAEGLDVGPAKLQARRLPATAWAESWKRHFKPLAIGSALVIRPSWRRGKPRKGQAVVILDPGLSFGTGQHPTTEFCLRQLVRHRNRDTSMMDLGTGSGILAIAAAKLGYRPVCAYELDPDALRVACANARRNQVLDRIRFSRRDVARMPLRPRRRFDVVCANLIADLLVRERDRVIATVAKHGLLVLAGILDSEFNRVRLAYESAGFRLMDTAARGEWRSGSFTAES